MVPRQPVNEAGLKMEVLLSIGEFDEICKEKGLKTKSAMIRHLWALGYTRSAIAKYMGCKYQMVRNILTQSPKKSTVVTPEMEPSGDAQGD
jgi:predicted transcriptional regulator